MDFEQLEKEFGRVTVEVDEPGITGAGTLDLAGQKTLAVLTTDQMFMARANQNGWFDVRLKTNRGRDILLHNAITLGTTMPTQQNKKYENRIFANSVIVDCNYLSRSGRVSEISFTLQDLGYFFHYEQIESHFLAEPSKELVQAIKKLRRAKILKQYPREFAFFRPRDVHIVHDMPPIFRFRIGEKTYEAGRIWGSSFDFGAETRLTSEPILRIRFDKAVPIDEALRAVWEWRRFFSQAAMAPLVIKSVSARSRGNARTGHASFYLSNVTREEQRAARLLDFYPGGSPFFRWKDRAKLGDLMKAWLMREGQRHVFRASLDRVIEAMQTRNSLEDVVTLCSAIESLAELDGQAPIQRKDVKILAEGALRAADAANLTVDASRVRGVLGMLRNQSLPQRMQLLRDALTGVLPADYLSGVTTSAYSLRQVASHGQALEEPVVPSVAPTIRALAGMCALYDLTTCGAPARYEEHHNLTALGYASHFGGYLRQLGRQSAGRSPAA